MWRRVLLFLALASPASATGTVRVEVKHRDQPLSGASVIANGQSYLTDGDGVASFPSSPGILELVIAKDGFLPVSTSLVVEEGEAHVVEVLLEQMTHREEVTVVATTRSQRGIEEQPMRVEVLGREEIEEKMLMTPGDIVMMLNEMGGMRVAATSPSLGAASVRIQGMRGRYTQFLSDGLPLYGEQPGGLALLQIPPMDLGRVEVIKGVASALYGGGAMGGVVNLLSRRPGEEAQREVLVNASTRGATDAVLWVSSPLSPFWSFSLLGSGHGQDRVDVDGDDWSDIAGYGRGVMRPRLFWDGGEGRSFFVTAGFTYEDRTGGTLPDSVLRATGEPYEESLLTRRYDVGAVGQTLVGGRHVLSGRVAVTRGIHDHLFGDTRERDRHDTAFAEVTFRGSAGGHTWIAGAAFEHDGYRPEDVPRFAFSFGTVGAFFQDDVDVADWLGLSLSARLDRHNEYGTFLSPRFSALLRQGRWTGRVSLGSGFFAPTPLTEETEAAGLTRLSIPGPLSAERGRSVSLDVSHTDGPLTTTLTLFASRIDESILVERSTQYLLRNVDGGTTNTGVEILATFRRSPFAATGTYTYVRSIESDGGLSRDVELTPRHSAGLVAMLEDDDVGRLGFELYFTGEQRLEANPYRSTSQPYVIVGVLAERRFGRFRIFVNSENLSNVRQSRWDPLLRPERNVDGRWTVDAWAPLEGRVINGGVRIDF
ncbi:MAG TPA: TonB-dependent receptor [Vicinamibacteria bacterium]|nr:TonB-dependent receptor [Vicinamibacteria bacterium]